MNASLREAFVTLAPFPGSRGLPVGTGHLRTGCPVSGRLGQRAEKSDRQKTDSVQTESGRVAKRRRGRWVAGHDRESTPRGLNTHDRWWYPLAMKYRHHGYQDADYKKERKQAPAPKREDDGMPRPSRLAEKRPSTLVFRCHNCGRQALAPEAVSATEMCTGCGTPLHCCMNCMQFDPGVPRECREPAVTVALFSKRDANECSYFAPKAVLDSSGRRQEAARAPSARQAFDDLFKK